MNPIVLVVTHKPEVMLSTSIATPINVNHKIDVPPHWLSDNEGDNIAEKNANYCELTAMYWAWKNLPKEYTHVGLFHYRRILKTQPSIKDYWVAKYSLGNENLNDYFNDDSLENMLARYDLLLPKEESQHMSIAKHYKCRHIPEDWDVLISVLREKHPIMFDEIDSYFNQTKRQFWANMFVMKRDVFAQYCEWLFDILFEVEKRIQVSAYPYQARVFGFMAERLMNMYFQVFVKELKVKRLPCVMRKDI